MSPPRPTLPADDAQPTRQRLLCCALAMFAAKGYGNTSIREIAEAAHTNVASISYHFGDKAGLYRAVFFEPMGGVEDELAGLGDPRLCLDEALHAFITGMLAPLRQGEAARLSTTLRFREILEPTGLWDEEIRHSIIPVHRALDALLVRHLGLSAPDLEVQRLSIAITSLVVHLMISQDVIASFAPALLDSPGALDDWGARLTTYALGMVDAERARRATVCAASLST